MAGLFLVAGLLFVQQGFAAPGSAAALSPRCKEVSFTVNGAATNYDLSGINATHPGNITKLVNATYGASSGSTFGDETLAGWFCEPTVSNANNTKLQLFRGSFFTNRESWTALGGTALFDPPLEPYQPSNYSWFDYANNLGYPTLAIDTLGDGNSSRPDGLLVAQIPYQLSIYHDLVQQIRGGTTGELPSAYSYIAHIGNSLGSTIGSQMAIYYPDDFDSLVLTGFSKDVLTSFVGVALNIPLPAVVLNATRFAGVPLDYLTSSLEASLTNSFFGDPKYVDFDPEVAHLFFERRDTVSLGDVVTTYLLNGFPYADKFTGRVLVLTGEHDQAYCGLGSALLDPNNNVCGTLLNETQVLFPAADYNYQVVPRTGHALVFHTTSQYSFGVAHDFLAGVSFPQTPINIED